MKSGFYTVQGLADKLKVSRNIIYELVRRGELRAYRVGRRLRFSPKCLDDYLDSVVVRID